MTKLRLVDSDKIHLQKKERQLPLKKNAIYMNPKSNKPLSNAFFDVARANRNVPTSEAAHGQPSNIVFD